MVFYDALIITFVRYVEKIKNTPLHCLDTSNRCYFFITHELSALVVGNNF